MNTKTLTFLTVASILFVACNAKPQDKTDAEIGDYDSMHVIEKDAEGNDATVIYYAGNQEKVRQYYSDRSLRCKGTIVNGLREGHWVFYFPNGNIQAECTYFGGKEDGPYRVMRENGAPYYIGQYTMGVRTGTWEIYDQDGILVTTQDYGTPNS